MMDGICTFVQKAQGARRGIWKGPFKELRKSSYQCHEYSTWNNKVHKMQRTIKEKESILLEIKQNERKIYLGGNYKKN